MLVEKSVKRSHAYTLICALARGKPKGFVSFNASKQMRMRQSPALFH